MLTTRLHRLLFAFYLAAALAVVFVLPALAQAEPPAPANLAAALNNLATGGAAAAVAVLVSWIAANIPAFNAQSPAAKFVEQAGASVLLGVGSWYLITYQPALVAQAAPVFAVIVASLAPLFANQIWHQVTAK